MQMLTIALLKEKGLFHLAAGLLGATTISGDCVYREGDKRCIAGCTFNDDTLQEVDENGWNEGTPFNSLLGDVISVPDNHTMAVYEVSQAIHDAWATESHVAMMSLDGPRSELTNTEDAFLLSLGTRTVTQDDLRQWLELIS